MFPEFIVRIWHPPSSQPHQARVGQHRRGRDSGALTNYQEDLDGDELDLVAYELCIQSYFHPAQDKSDSFDEDSTTSVVDVLPSPEKLGKSNQQLASELVVPEFSSSPGSIQPFTNKKALMIRNDKALATLLLAQSPDSNFTAYKKANAQLSPSGKKWRTRKRWTDKEFQIARDALSKCSGGVLISDIELPIWETFWTYVYSRDSKFPRN
ncbi:hypothetical protein FRB90_007827, partial [Tulasnella sp. 427]